MELSSGIISMIYQMKRKCAHIDQKLMEQLNISPSELLFFSSLDNCTVINSNELARSMGLSASRVSRIVDMLFINGYLERNIDSTDRRAITICLTPKGEAIKQKIDKERMQCEKQILNALPGEELIKFREILDKIITTL